MIAIDHAYDYVYLVNGFVNRRPIIGVDEEGRSLYINSWGVVAWVPEGADVYPKDITVLAEQLY